MPVPESLLVAIGGNATHPESIHGTTEEQELVADAAAQIGAGRYERTDTRVTERNGSRPSVDPTSGLLCRSITPKIASASSRPGRCPWTSTGSLGLMESHSGKPAPIHLLGLPDLGWLRGAVRLSVMLKDV